MSFFNSRRQKQNNPLAKVVIGLLLLVSAFIMLWLNEGRVNLANVARTSVQVVADDPDPRTVGELIGVSGTFDTEEQLGDEGFLRYGAYIALERTVEMYAWQEKSETDDSGNTSYRYESAWSADPENSAEFEDKSYVNPPLPQQSESWRVGRAQIGRFQINPHAIELPSMDKLALNQERVEATEFPFTADYIFIGQGSLNDPEIGDVRLSYQVVPSGIAVTAFGQNGGDTLAPYNYRGKVDLYRVLHGDRQEAIDTLQFEYTLMLWVFRFAGSIMMWIGVALLFSPITALLSFIPILNDASQVMVGIISFLIALPLAVTTIVISFIAHSWWAMLLLVVTVIIGIGGMVFWQKQRQDKGFSS